MEAVETIGNNIHKFRVAQGLTQENLADYLDVSRELISLYENGNRSIPVTSLDKLADLFGVDLEELLEENATLTKTNLAFAFRSKSITDTDIQSIAEFKKIVSSYLKMNTILNAANE